MRHRLAFRVLGCGVTVERAVLIAPPASMVEASHNFARLLATTGLGHRRILREPAVVEEVIAFLKKG